MPFSNGNRSFPAPIKSQPKQTENGTSDTYGKHEFYEFN
jgi:hypothetical protein